MPRQARAVVTLEAILEATIQVLIAVGPTGLTTTRVAERAGVSVGTMYQYFPNKEALLDAAMQQYFGAVAERVERAYREQHGAPLATLAEALVEAFWQATFERCDVSRAIYLAAGQLDAAEFVAALRNRLEKASACMFATAPDAAFADLSLVTITLSTALFATVRSLVDRNLPKPWACGLKEQLITMSRSYVGAAKDVPLLARAT